MLCGIRFTRPAPALTAIRLISVRARLRTLAVSPISTSPVANFRIGAKSSEEKLPDFRNRCGCGKSARFDHDELKTWAGAGDEGLLPGLPTLANRRGFAKEIGDAKSSNLYLSFGRSLRGSRGFNGSLFRDCKDDVE